MLYILRDEEDSFQVKYEIKLGDVCLSLRHCKEGGTQLNFTGPNSSGPLPSLDFFSVAELSDLHNTDCWHPPQNRLMPNYAKETRHPVAQIFKPLC